MPVSTRQATPGPSNATPTMLLPQTHSRNTKKRSGSEVHEDTRDSKKIKIDGKATTRLSSVNGKDKKKRRKRKKRTSIVVSQPEQTEKARSKSKSVPLTSDKLPSIPGRELVESGATTLDEEEPVLSSSDKGKGKAKSESPSQLLSTLPSHSAQPVASGSDSSNMITPDSTAQISEIARLREQLAAQGKLLERHQTHFSHHQQSLTCQICLDLMHKPYALAPCGHITCYGCLVRWFTAINNPEIPLGMANGDNLTPAVEGANNLETVLESASARNGLFIRRRKKCPVCRAVVIDRPIEMWGIKSMVSAFVRSGLADLPVPAPPAPAAEEGLNSDPWRNVFRKAGSTRQPFGGALAALLPPPGEQADGDREQMGWYDVEDGGLYRCIDCYHEILGGICTSCNRGYPGHGEHDDDDDDEEDDLGHDHFGRHQMMVDFTDEEDEDDTDIWLERHPHARMVQEQEHWSDSEDGELDELELPHYHPFYPQHLHAQFYNQYGLPVPGGRNQRGNGAARIEEVGDDEEEEEESEYGGSFIDDDHHEEGYEGQSGDEVEFVDGPAQRPRLRRRLMTDDDEEEAEENEEEEEIPDPRIMAHRLSRGSRLQRRVVVRPPSRLMSESEGSTSELEVVDLDEEEYQIPEQHGRSRLFVRSAYGASDDDEDPEW